MKSRFQLVRAALIAALILNPLSYAFADGETCQAAFAAAGGLESAPKALMGKEAKQSAAGAAEIKLSPEVSFSAFNLVADDAMANMTSRSDPRYGDALRRLLNGFANTVFISVDPKTTGEKGEMYLGWDIGNDQILEAKYEAKEGANGRTYHLIKLSYVKPNLEKTEIDKKPVTDDGRGLLRTHVFLASENAEVSASGKVKPMKLDVLNENNATDYFGDSDPVAAALKSNGHHHLDFTKVFAHLAADMNAADRARLESVLENMQQIQIPVLISGPLVKAIDTWSNRLQHLSRAELRNGLQNGRVGVLMLAIRANAKNAASYVFIKIGVKQFVKYTLIFGIMGAIASALMPPKETGAKFKMISGIESGILTRIESIWTKRAVHADPSTPEGKKVIAEIDLRTVTDDNAKNSPRSVQENLIGYRDLIQKLQNAEAAAGGKSVMLASDYDMDNVKELSASDAGVSQPANSAVDGGYIIAEFPKTMKIVITPIIKSVVNSVIGNNTLDAKQADESMSEPMVSATVIDGREYPETYNGIAKMISSQLANATK